ncbi:flagellar filament capping protein FliD [Rickettsiales bacterium]|nr:flagellar filament capping protein FliD [Rickettsiales bacterium]
MTIDFGTIVQQNGRTTASGFASGLDSKSLIDGILEGQTVATDRQQDTIDLNSNKLTAIAEMQTLLERFKTTADFLRSPPGVKNSSSDLFKYTSATVTSNTSIAASTYLNVTTTPGAVVGNKTITDIALAKEQIIRLSGFTSDTSDVVKNTSVTDDYSAVLGTVPGTVLNTTTPVTFSNDQAGTRASIDIVFGTQNVFNASDNIVFGSTTITFGGGGGNDIDISAATTVSAKVSAIAARMNAITSGDESKYVYIAHGETLTVERAEVGANADIGINGAVGTNLNITANFSNTDTTQTVKIGSQDASNNPAGGALNSLGTEGALSAKATLDIVFGPENNFEKQDSITFGATKITFGGTGGNDIDISSAATVSAKLAAIVTRMNAVTTGTEANTNYTYSSSGNTLTITRDTVGALATIGSDLTVTSDFSKGNSTTASTSDDKTQTVQIGNKAASNASVSGTVSANGIDGYPAPTKANIKVKFGSQNEFDLSSDSISFGSTTVTFATPGTGDAGDVLDITGETTLLQRLTHVVNHMNKKTTGEEAGYNYSLVNEGSGEYSILVTREVFGKHATVDTDMTVASNFSSGSTNQVVTLGFGGALAVGPSNGSQTSKVNVNGTEGVDVTTITDANTTHTTTLSGAITMNTPVYVAGSSDGLTFTPNQIIFKATVGGENYTSRPVILDGGSLTGGGGSGTNNFGDAIAAGTVITFIKDDQSDDSTGQRDVAFNLVVGNATTIADSAAATTYATTSIKNVLDTGGTGGAAISITNSQTNPFFRAGTFALGKADITLAEGDNLQVIKTKINALSSLTGVTAEILKVAENSYNLNLKSSNTGLDYAINRYNTGGRAHDTSAGVMKMGGGNVTFTQTQAAADSEFKLDGVTITRSSNSIGDALDNVTFSLLGDTKTAAPSTSLKVDISENNDVIKNGVIDFLNSYNDLRFFISKHEQREADGTLKEDAILGDDAILRDALNAINTSLSKTVAGLTEGNLKSLFEVGIDTINFPGDDTNPATSGVFVIDEAKFDSAIEAKFDQVRKIFAYDFVANSNDISVFKRSNKSTLTSFKIDIDITRAESDQVRVLDINTGATLFNMTFDRPKDNRGFIIGTGGTLKGKAGTALEGMELVYTGDGTDVITVSSATQGVADYLYNSLDNFLDENGNLESTTDSLKTENERIQEDMEKALERISKERDRLIAEFSRLETFIASVNNTLSFFEAERAALTSR